MQRLRNANLQPDSGWAALITSGLKQSGASTSEVAAAEDRLSRDFPRSEQASRIAFAGWRKEHKEPEDEKNTQAWTAYYAAYRKQLELWSHTFTEAPDLEVSKFYAAASDPALTEADGLQQVDAYLKHQEIYAEPGSFYDNAASILLDRHWQPARSLELMVKAMEHDRLQRTREQLDDNQAQNGLYAQSMVREHLELISGFLRAALAADRPAAIAPYRAEIEAQPPLDVKGAEYRWWANRARIATLDGRRTGALAFYHKALQTRPSPPEYWHGVWYDPLTEDAKTLWAAMGGSESTWKLWNPAPQPDKPQLAQGRWDKAPADMPAFEFADKAKRSC